MPGPLLPRRTISRKSSATTVVRGRLARVAARCRPSDRATRHAQGRAPRRRPQRRARTVARRRRRQLPGKSCSARALTPSSPRRCWGRRPGWSAAGASWPLRCPSERTASMRRRARVRHEERGAGRAGARRRTPNMPETEDTLTSRSSESSRAKHAEDKLSGRRYAIFCGPRLRRKSAGAQRRASARPTLSTYP